MTEPKPSQPTEPSQPAPDDTLRLQAGEPTDPGRPLRMEPPVLQPPEPPRPPASRPGRQWVAWGVVALGALGGALYLFLPRSAAPAPPARGPAAQEPVPPGVQVYLDQARAGDAHAMRMLGVMYYYGLNVPQDREKGLAWYRKAADKGSDAAREELAKLQRAGAVQ